MDHVHDIRQRFSWIVTNAEIGKRSTSEPILEHFESLIDVIIRDAESIRHLIAVNTPLKKQG